MEEILGKPFWQMMWEGNQADIVEAYRRFCQFGAQCGYDAIPVEFGATYLVQGGEALCGRKPALIRNLADIERFPWDELPARYIAAFDGQFRALAEALPPGMKAIGGIGNGVFETAQDFVPLTELAFLRADDPEAYALLWRKVGDLFVKLWTWFLDHHADAFVVCRMGDDLGYRSSTMLSPSDIRTHVIPQYRRVVSLVHAKGKPFLYHCCGRVFGVLDDVIREAAIDAKHSNEDAVALKMDPFLVAVAMALPKVVGALTDPVAGAWSDNARTRWGRRRPFILWGAVVGAVLLPLVWTPIAHTQTGMFLHLAVVLGISAAAYSAFAVPYGALGYELTTDYDERTRVLAWRAYIVAIGTFTGSWFYWFCLRPCFGNEIVGVRWLSAIGMLFILGGAATTVSRCRENTRHVLQQPKIPLRDALVLTLKNRPFLVLQATVLIIAVGMGCEGLIGNYVHIYYTCQGNKDLASLISGMGGTLTVFSSLAAVPMGLFLSTHLGKRQCALVGLLIGLVGIVILPWTLVYEHPYRVIISWVTLALGMPCASLMFGSMTADICDEDELATGLRREGAYVAVAGFFGKIVAVLTLLLGGWLPRMAGYRNTDALPTLNQLDAMRVMLIVIQLATILSALALVWFYPVTRARSEGTRRILDEREGLRAAARPSE